MNLHCCVTIHLHHLSTKVQLTTKSAAEVTNLPVRPLEHARHVR